MWHVYLRVELYARMTLRCEFLFCRLTDASNEKYFCCYMIGYETTLGGLVDFEGRRVEEESVALPEGRLRALFRQRDNYFARTPRRG